MVVFWAIMIPVTVWVVYPLTQAARCTQTVRAGARVGDDGRSPHR